MAKRKRWLLWSAVSSLPQALKVSLDDQLKLGAEHAAKHDGEIVGKLIVPGQSRNIVLFETARKRIKAYDELAGMIERREFDIFAFLDRSRLGRTAALSMTVVALCEEAGIFCYELESPPTSLDIDGSHDSMLIGAIKSVGAEREIYKIQERHTSGMIGRIESGKFPTVPPFGYMHDPNTRDYKIIINEKEAAIVRKITELYIAGRGEMKIKEELDAIGAKSRTGTTVAVMEILKNIDLYTGRIIYNRRAKKNKPIINSVGLHPPIISEQICDAVKAEKRSRGENRKVASEQCYLLSSVCHCVNCGLRMYISRTRSGGSKNRFNTYLVCRTSRHTRANHSARHDTILAELKEFISKFDVDSIDISGLDIDTKTGLIDDRRKLLHESIKRLENAKSRAADAFTDGYMDVTDYKRQQDRIRNEIGQCREELESLDMQEKDLERKSGIKERIADFIKAAPQILDGTDVNRVNAWLRSSCRIYIKDKHIYHIDIF